MYSCTVAVMHALATMDNAIILLLKLYMFKRTVRATVCAKFYNIIQLNQKSSGETKIYSLGFPHSTPHRPSTGGVSATYPDPLERRTAVRRYGFWTAEARSQGRRSLDIRLAAIVGPVGRPGWIIVIVAQFQ